MFFIKKKVTIFFVLLLLISKPSFSESPVSSYIDILRYDENIKAGILLSIKQAYDEAISVFQQIKKESPQSPIGYFFHAAVLQTQMMDYEKYEQEKAFYALLDSAIALSKKQIKRNKKDAWAYFYLGSSYGYLSFYLSKQKDYVKSFQNARLSVKALETAIKIDSTLYDAYLGLGTYKYYRSHFSKYLNWVPFIDDEREMGLEWIKIAMHKSRYSRYSSISNICWILIEEQRYQEGLNLINPITKAFPESRIFMWCGAKLAKKVENWQDAITYYNKILDSFTNENISSPFNELTCRKNLNKIYMHLQQHDKAEEECRKASEIEFDKKSHKKYSRLLKAMEKCTSNYSM